MRIVSTASALGLLALAILLVGITQTVNANPPGIPDGAKMEYKFNLIGKPNDFDGNCGQGRRIFVNRGANNAKMLITAGPTWDIIDCNATGNNRAELQTNAQEMYLLFVRILGRPGGTLDICANTYEDWEAGEELCLLGEINLTRGQGKSHFNLVPREMFDASLEDIMWEMDTNHDFRIAQFRIYSVPLP
jgi:hypothetical protein